MISWSTNNSDELEMFLLMCKWVFLSLSLSTNHMYADSSELVEHCCNSSKSILMLFYFHYA